LFIKNLQFQERKKSRFFKIILENRLEIEGALVHVILNIHLMLSVSFFRNLKWGDEKTLEPLRF